MPTPARKKKHKTKGKAGDVRSTRGLCLHFVNLVDKLQSDLARVVAAGAKAATPAEKTELAHFAGECDALHARADSMAGMVRGLLSDPGYTETAFREIFGDGDSLNTIATLTAELERTRSEIFEFLNAAVLHKPCALQKQLLEHQKRLDHERRRGDDPKGKRAVAHETGGQDKPVEAAGDGRRRTEYHDIYDPRTDSEEESADGDGAPPTAAELHDGSEAPRGLPSPSPGVQDLGKELLTSSGADWF